MRHGLCYLMLYLGLGLMPRCASAARATTVPFRLHVPMSSIFRRICHDGPSRCGSSTVAHSRVTPSR
jgi:hypothetical protein